MNEEKEDIDKTNMSYDPLNDKESVVSVDKTNMTHDPLNDKESLTSEDTSTSVPPSYCTTEKAETTTTRR